MPYSLVTGDTGSILRVTCKDNSTGAAINLTGATVKAQWKDSVQALVSRVMTITSAPGGIAEYQFAAGEIISPIMRIEIEVIDATGKIVTSLNPIEISVRSQIG